MKVLVMSDTHGVLRPEVNSMFKNCDALIHAGDFCTQKTIDEITNFVGADIPVFMVRGNNDGKWASYLPVHLEFILNGIKFYVVHDKKDLPEDLGECRVVIYGHSHRYQEEIRDGRLYLNPGSCGRRRFKLDLTLAVLYLDAGKISVERVDISEGNVKDKEGVISQGNLSGFIQDIMKRMDKGWKIDRISKELGLNQSFVEDICHIRVTHPGVSAEEILNKIEANKSRVCNRRMIGNKGVNRQKGE